jgi:hypothetical protein
VQASNQKGAVHPTAAELRERELLLLLENCRGEEYFRL